MGRFVGVGGDRSAAGSGSGAIVETSPFTKATGITTDSSNNVTAVTLGENSYSNVQYHSVGLITAYHEVIGTNTKGWILTYEADTNLIATIVERDEPHP